MANVKKKVNARHFQRGEVEFMTFNIPRSPSLLGYTLRHIRFTDDQGYHTFVDTTVSYFFSVF